MSGYFNRGGPPPPSGGGRPPPGRNPYDRAPSGQGYGGPPQQDYIRAQYGAPEKHSYDQQPSQRMPVGGTRGGPPGGMLGGGGPARQLRPAKSPPAFTFANKSAVSPRDFPQQPGASFYVMVNDLYVLTAQCDDSMQAGTIGLNDDQRTWAAISLQDVVDVKIYDAFAEGNKQTYLASVETEVSFRGRKTTAEQIDQEELGAIFVKNFESQILSPGQRILMDYKSIPLLFKIQVIHLGDLGQEKPAAGSEALTLPTFRGILTKGSQMMFNKDASSPINLKASKRRPAANRILQPNFKFEDMGIGGLDKEFGDIFRRAFASRLLPPGLVQEMGIQYVKGILLHGPPGTGKTLIARKIGQMLNAREPKVINGPEVLNKYVGQSEENIRKLFADAEKEYKEKGDESGLHIIIFDELDAVCKQRGSGAGGGTGVGDSVVNQLLSKLDGVDQLNNILLIGMTNRKDMIDDALLRPGRLEVHMEIPLPDEKGRLQILNIHTSQLRQHNRLAPNVDMPAIAHKCKNYSGAELSGVVRAAVSYVASRNLNPGSMADMSNLDIDKIVVDQEDFLRAADEVTPAFGIAEDEFSGLMVKGIINYSAHINSILEQGQTIVQQVQTGQLSSLYTALVHGPSGAGKTALAARIALNSGFPFIKLITSTNMVGMNAAMSLQHISKVFDDAYKSPLSVIVIDDLEKLFDWIDEGPRFENALRKAVDVLLTKRPPEGHRLLILATTSFPQVMHRLNLWSNFKSEIAVPPVRTYEELGNILQQSGAFTDVRGALSEVQQITQKDSINVGIKQILYDIEGAQQREEDVNGEFASQLSRDIARQGYD